LAGLPPEGGTTNSLFEAGFLAEQDAGPTASHMDRQDERAAIPPGLVRPAEMRGDEPPFVFVVATFIGGNDEPIDLNGFDYRVKQLHSASPHRSHPPQVACLLGV
jgi:hypothetical protein